MDEKLLLDLVGFCVDADLGVRQVAVRGLAAVAPQGNAESLEALVSATNEPSLAEEAWRALSRLTVPGDVELATSACLVTCDSELAAPLRIAALEAALQAAGPNCGAAMVFLEPLVSDRDDVVRAAVLEGFGRLAADGCSLALAKLVSSCWEAERSLGCLYDPAWEVRLALLRGLCELDVPDPEHASQVGRALERLAEDDPSRAVRCTALEALAHLRPEDRSVIALFNRSCSDSSPEVRAAALQILQAACARHSQDDAFESLGMAAVKACLESWEAAVNDPALQKQSLETAVAIIGRNDPEVVRLVARGLESRSEELRAAAVRGLPLVADGDDELVVAQLVRRIADERPPVRRAALAAMKEVIPRGNDVAVLLLCSKAGGPVMEVRLIVLEALRYMARRGDEAAIAEISARLQDGEAAVRAAAVAALADVASFDDPQSIAKVILRLEDVDEGVRKAVAEAVPRLAGPGNPKAMECLAYCCRSMRPPPHRENTRKSACLCLAKFAEKGDPQAIALMCESIHRDYPEVTAIALRLLLEVAPRGHHAAIEGAASALCHREAKSRDIATEVLEQLTENPKAPQPALASVAAHVELEGRWSGGSIKGRKIFWDDGGLISTFQLNGSTLTTTCEDAYKRRFPSRAQLDAQGRLHWDFGAVWQRLAEASSARALTNNPKELPAANSTKELGWSKPAQLQEKAAAKASESDPETNKLQLAVHISSKSQVYEEEADYQSDYYALACVAAHFNHKAESVREAAVVALPRVAGSCPATVEALIPMLKDESVKVRFAAIESIAAVAEPGDWQAINALTASLSDQGQIKDQSAERPNSRTVGLHAARVLKQLVPAREDLERIVASLKVVTIGQGAKVQSLCR